MQNKIIRTICLFKKEINGSEVDQLFDLEEKLKKAGFEIQTKRICSPQSFGELEKQIVDPSIMLSVGTLDFKTALKNLNLFYKTKDNFNIELSKEILNFDYVDLLFEIIKNAPQKTFNFTYVFNNAHSSPYMPSASYQQDGFAIGLQPTDLAINCQSLEDWFLNLKNIYLEINDLFKEDKNYLGIDSSIAPLFEGDSSLVNIINRIYPNGFNQSFTTDIYTKISKFIKSENPKPAGLCGIMMPCLEDFELGREYEKGNFSIERNIYVSLHSGLGIDTYPIGVDEKPERVLEILKLLQALSNKYQKPLSARFVSDGKAIIGEKSNFKNPYLYDVLINKL